MSQAAPSATLAVDRVLQRCISLYATIRLTPCPNEQGVRLRSISGLS